MAFVSRILLLAGAAGLALAAALPELRRALARDYAALCGREPVLHVSRFGPGALAATR